MFDNTVSQLQTALTDIQQNMPYVLYIMAGLYTIHFINWLVGYRLNILGLYPRKIYGLPGIFFSPFLHGNFNHLFFNSIPLFVLLNFLLIPGWKSFLIVTGLIVTLSGIATWLFGRRGVHIGASSLIMGYWSYLLVNAYYHPTIVSIILAIVCAYYFGGLVLNLFPQAERTSWEGHVFGFLAGLATAYLMMFWGLTN